MKDIDSKIIDELGGTTAVARLCRVTKGAVSQWRLLGIPQAREMYLRVVRPEAFSGVPMDRNTKVGVAEMAPQNLMEAA